MQVVLLKPVRKLGNIGSVVSVKPGYGRNFLIPQGIARRATKEGMEAFAQQKAELEAKNTSHLVDVQALASSLDKADLMFVRQASFDGRLFGSVSAKDIAIVLAKRGCIVQQSDVFINGHIKSIGIFEVSVNLHPLVRISLLINVARTESEGIDALKLYKDSSKVEKVSDMLYQQSPDTPVQEETNL